MQQNSPNATNYIKLNVSQIARELVYGSEPRTPRDRLVTYKEMQDYVARAISIAFGQYIHGLEYGRSRDKFSVLYRLTNGVNCNVIAVPDGISPHLITEEKCTFNSYKTRDCVAELQLQLEGYVCNVHLGILKVRRIYDNTVTRHVICLNKQTSIDLIERYIEQTLLPYL